MCFGSSSNFSVHSWVSSRAPSVQFSSVQFSHSVVSDSLRPHESQHARPPCPSPTPRVHSDSRPSSQWCHQAISSSLVPFSSCPQSLPASESFPMSQPFSWGGQSTGVSALASFLPRKSQGWSPSEWTAWICLQSNYCVIHFVMCLLYCWAFCLDWCFLYLGAGPDVRLFFFASLFGITPAVGHMSVSSVGPNAEAGRLSVSWPGHLEEASMRSGLFHLSHAPRPRSTRPLFQILLDLLRGRQSAHGHAFPPEADGTVAVVVHLGFPVPVSGCWPSPGQSLPSCLSGAHSFTWLWFPVATSSIWLKWARMIETGARKGGHHLPAIPRVLDIFQSFWIFFICLIFLLNVMYISTNFTFF